MLSNHPVILIALDRQESLNKKHKKSRAFSSGVLSARTFDEATSGTCLNREFDGWPLRDGISPR